MALLLLPLSGCSALFAFIHDKTIGPISPAGNVHSATAGEDFRVSDEGVRVASSEWWFRPYPRDMLARMGRPQSFWFAFKGIEAFFYGISPVVLREVDSGREVPAETLRQLEPRQTTSAQVLEKLGPPQLWLRRREGSVMAYRADKRRVLAFWIGTPPFVDIIPGANNLSFRYLYERRRPFKTILFFDRDERLLGLASNAARMEQDEERAEDVQQ
ncbi:MAG: hypothetical protein AB7N76_07970 [Planctomycetota bacterium]